MSVRRWLPPLVLLLALVGIWEAAAQSGALADVLNLDSFLVPAPSEVATAFWDNRSLIIDNAWVTLQEVLLGFAIALVAGLLIAVALHLSPLMRRGFYPLVVASQAIPIIVVAPILVVWFGFGIGPKIAIVALLCFFPIAVNTLDGLGTAGSDERKLMRSLGAGRTQTMALLEAPTALPYLLSGAKVAIAVAVIGAVFGEWSGGNEGLGLLILRDNNQLEVARVFASMFVLAAMAISLFVAVSLLERRFAWWGTDGGRSPEGGSA